MDKFFEKDGFTLVESMIAIMVLTIGVLSLFTMMTAAISGNSSASQMTRAATAGTDQLENIFAMNYAALVDTDNDSVAGLYNFDNATADGMATTTDGYTIYWNVADNRPMPATKRVVVNVVRTDGGYRRNVAYEYIKAEVVPR